MDKWCRIMASGANQVCMPHKLPPRLESESSLPLDVPYFSWRISNYLLELLVSVLFSITDAWPE